MNFEDIVAVADLMGRVLPDLCSVEELENEFTPHPEFQFVAVDENDRIVGAMTGIPTRFPFPASEDAIESVKINDIRSGNVFYHVITVGVAEEFWGQGIYGKLLAYMETATSKLGIVGSTGASVLRYPKEFKNKLDRDITKNRISLIEQTIQTRVSSLLKSDIGLTFKESVAMAYSERHVKAVYETPGYIDQTLSKHFGVHAIPLILCYGFFEEKWAHNMSLIYMIPFQEKFSAAKLPEKLVVDGVKASFISLSEDQKSITFP